MEGPEPPLSPSEIRLLRLLLQRAAEPTCAHGITLGPQGGCPTTARAYGVSV